MSSFSMHELSRRIGDILQAVERNPVILTKNRKDRYVIMTKEDYDSLKGRAADPRRVLDLGNLSAEDDAELTAALDQAGLDD